MPNLLDTIILAVLCTFLGGCTTIPLTGSQRTASSSISYAILGSGRPVVVLQSGLGDDRNPWGTVASRLARTHKVFAYDRPGYGASTDTQDARDPCTIANELHTLLSSQGIQPPYILAGHSLGGLYQYAFAKLYPAEVAGLVLVDATHPRHWRKMQSEAPSAAAVLSGMRATVFSATMRREFDAQDQCVEQLAAMPLNKPVRILVRTQFDLFERGSFEHMVHSLEQDWLKLTGASLIEPVANAGHYIQKDQPERVVAAIEAVSSQRQD